MPGRVEGKVCFVTGAARGQGRSHAIRLAEEGADIIAIDIADQIDTIPYAMGTADDLAETVKQVEALDRRIVAAVADVRDFDAVKSALEDGVAQLGRLDVACGNAGICSAASIEDMDAATWDDMIATNLTGVFHTVKAAIPHLRAAGGGSIVLTGSTGSELAFPNLAHYVSAKHGVVGLMRTAALELADAAIRVNVVIPTNTNTDMINNPAMYELFAPDLPEARRTREEIEPRFAAMNVLPIPYVEPRDISNAVLWLASDASRYVTGTELRVDAGQLIHH